MNFLGLSTVSNIDQPSHHDRGMEWLLHILREDLDFVIAIGERFLEAKPAEIEVAISFTLLLMALTLSIVLPPSIRLVRRTFCISYPTAFKHVIRYIWHERSMELKKELYRSVRLRVELELLHPRPTRPFLLPQDPAKRREVKEKYRRSWDEWKIKHDQLRDHLSSQLHEGNPEIIVKTCFDLQKAEDGIRRYFDALQAEKCVRNAEKGCFICTVKVETGFVAPLHLLTGLLSHFEQDWVRVINEYGRSVTRPDDPLDCRRLQTFLFNCWLLWGPSVPLCQCDYWLGGKAIQYGFGDENNSIPLFFKSDDDLVTKLLTSPDAKANLAFKATVTGRPRSGATHPSRCACGCLHTDEVCAAQQVICNPEQYGFVLEHKEHVLRQGGQPEERAGRYYSAYAWIMFVLRDEHGQPLSEKEPWRNLFPFFEHTNIADRETYELMKEQLARKALTGLRRILKDPSPGSRTWRLTYACALDDSGCESPLPFPHPGRLIKDTLRALLDTKEFADLQASGRILVEDRTDCRYSACRLPEIIEQFLEQRPHG